MSLKDVSNSDNLNGRIRWLTLAFLLLAPLSVLLPTFDQINNLYTDTLIAGKAAHNESDSRIVVIDIDEKSLKEMVPVAGRWPWPRAVHAQLLDQLLAQQPAVVVFDVFFSEPDKYRPDDDAWFSEVIRSSDRVFLPILQQQVAAGSVAPLLSEYPQQVGFIKTAQALPTARGFFLLPRAVDRQVWQVGTINFSEDHDGIGRRYDIYRELDGWLVPSLPQKVAVYLGKQPDYDQRHFILDWQSNTTRPYEKISYSDVLLTDQYSADYFRDRIVVIGSTAAGLHDMRATPIGSQYPGVFILSTAIDNLLNAQRYRELTGGWVVLLPALLIIALAVFITGRKLVVRHFVVPLAMTVVVLCLAWLLVQNNWLMPVVVPLLFAWAFFIAAFAMHYLYNQRELRHTISTFRRFLDPRVVDNLVGGDAMQDVLKSQSCEATVLFSDIRNFTTMSEQHEAHEIVDLLNGYFGKQVDVIFRHGGTLDKFIGDAVMAFWGAPIEQSDHAVMAVNAALDMVDALLDFREEYGFSELDIGIGVHTGPVVAGMLGSEQRYDYTVIGDTVNVASRIEGLTKNRARVLVSAQTRQACGDQLNFIDHGECSVKGREETVHIFEPVR